MFGSGFGPGSFALLTVPAIGPALITGSIMANTVSSIASSAGRSSGYRSTFPAGSYSGGGGYAKRVFTYFCYYLYYPSCYLC